ncbi:hypothetical protein CO610_09340 [Lysobacteraceae bacterium NML95-0200]|nr:hypothetical protein CO610_09340 [Xanthomonadaceae bacterium NML95-0200]
MKKAAAHNNPATKAYEAGAAMLRQHPVFGRLYEHVSWVRSEKTLPQASPWPADAWLRLDRWEVIHAHPKRLAEPAEWAYVLARGLLVYALEQWQPDHGDWAAWSAACDVVGARFLHSIKFGRAPQGMTLPPDLPAWDEVRWYRAFCEDGIPDWAASLSLGGRQYASLQTPADWAARPRFHAYGSGWRWADAFAAGIAESVTQAVEVAAGLRESLGGERRVDGEGRALRPATRRALDWFISSFPLLGSMVAAFEFVENAELCRREDISVAAVDETLRTVYLNPATALSEEETRFVIAHEVLHVALRHRDRCQGREPYLWNVACDFVINDWLMQMEVGKPPEIGLLYDPELKGLSAEDVYHRLTHDLRRARKLCTLAGRRGDMLDTPIGQPRAPFTDLDAFCREQLGKGLMLHQSQGRGFLPAGLLEEIRALMQPPIPWEVELAQWFDHHFPPIETRRSWARLSRRQSSTPDIPRPHIGPDPDKREGRTFGVVLDTSGSMSRHMLANALGAIASYAEAKEVPVVRLVCCDASAYDMGYMPANEIAKSVKIKGRGGTVLQPGIDFLQRAPDFPKTGPLLIITDGDCDTFSVHRPHAILLPHGQRLPFKPAGDVFFMK